MSTEHAHPIHQRLSDKRQERAELLRRLELLDAEIKTWEEAAALLDMPAETFQPPSGGDAGPVRRSRGDVTRERALTPQWADMMRFVGNEGVAKLDGMQAYANMMSYNIQRQTIRSQSAIYVERGWFERVGLGQFRLTESGAAKCGFVKKNEAPSGGAAGASEAVEG